MFTLIILNFTEKNDYDIASDVARYSGLPDRRASPAEHYRLTQRLYGLACKGSPVMITDALLAFGSLGLTAAVAIGVRFGFRRGRNLGEP